VNANGADESGTLAMWFGIAYWIAESLCRRMGVQGRPRVMGPDDYANEVLLKFWEALQTGAIRESPKAYLEGMIRNRIMDDLRKARPAALLGIESAGLPVEKVSGTGGVPRFQMRHDAPILLDKAERILSRTESLLLRFFARNGLALDGVDDRLMAALVLEKGYDAIKKGTQRLAHHLREADRQGLLDSPKLASRRSGPRPSRIPRSWQGTLDFVNGLFKSASEPNGPVVVNTLDFRLHIRLGGADNLSEEDELLLRGCAHLMKGVVLREALEAYPRKIAVIEDEDARNRFTALTIDRGLGSLAAAVFLFRALDHRPLLTIALESFLLICMMATELVDSGIFGVVDPAYFIDRGVEALQLVRTVLRVEDSDEPLVHEWTRKFAAQHEGLLGLRASLPAGHFALPHLERLEAADTDGAGTADVLAFSALLTRPYLDIKAGQ
jgi:hypothetical protein